MSLSLRLSSSAAPAALRLVAMLALAAGLGAWGAVLLAPSPPALPAALSASVPRAADNTPVALWFGRDETLSTQISVLGVIAAGANGAAVFSVDGGPPSAWRVGDEIVSGIVLKDIGADAITLEQGGRASRLAAPAPPASVGGITRAAP